VNLSWREELSEIEKILERTLPPAKKYPAVLHEAMRYSTLGGGKRLRALLIRGACRAVGGNVEKTGGFLAALEMIHAYSLIHDDLPCMDDDDLRRGKPANHKVYGEAVAVLAGDGLLTDAFFELAQLPQKYGVEEKTALRLVFEIAKNAGSRGMVGGQAVDIISEGREIDQATLDYIHRHKTGALIKAALRGGAILGGASNDELEAITDYAENFGLAFQITDDILDEVGDSASLGKETGADKRRAKQTFPKLYGLEKSREIVDSCIKKCRSALEGLSGDIQLLQDLAAFIGGRDH